ncbi:MAG TPA: PLP-dependent aminotransferase family protein, partial [Labilithrix sp.]
MDPRIERLQRASANARGVLCLAGGLPAEELFPRRAFAKAFERAVLRSPCGALQYGWPEGSEELRRWIAARLVARGAETSAEDVVVTAGAQQALAIAADLVGVSGARVGVDAETYPGALELLRARGAETVATGDAACHYVVPGASNPRGLGVSAERRARVLASGKPIVVDEAYAELRFDGRLEPLFLTEARDRVFHVGTFSKTLCPGFRIGWLVVPRALRDATREAKRELDLQAGSLAQAIVERWL